MRKNGIVVPLLVLTIILPVGTLLVWMFTERWAWPGLVPQVFSTRAAEEIFRNREELLGVLGSSIFISTAVGLLSVLIGTMTSRALVCYEFFGKKIIYFLTILPFMIPATVFAMGIQMTFIKIGLNNTITGVIIVHTICSLPYAVRIIIEGMEAVGNKLEEQARVLGASPVQAFRKVTLPILTPVLLSAMSMSYIVSFSQYFLTLLIGGGRVKTFSIVMVPYLQSGDRTIASVYSVMFLGITLVVFAVFEWITGRWNKNINREFYS